MRVLTFVEIDAQVAGLNPTPVLSALNPATATQGDEGFTLEITGEGFISSTTVRVNGVNRSTTFIDTATLEVPIFEADLEDAGTLSITAVNPSPGGGESNALELEIDVSNIDPHFANVVALVHIEGGTVTEVTGVSSVSLVGSTAITDSTAKFGTESLHIPGSGQDTAGLRMSHAGDRFVFPGEFTMEAWFRTGPMSGFASLFDGQRDFPAAGSWTLQSGANRFLLPVVNGNFSTGPNTGNNVLATNEWEHVAWTRDASNVQRIFVNGVLKGSATHAGTIGAQDGSLSHLNISRGIASDNSSFIGQIEEVRITKGVCRYTEDFTPPTAPFPDA